MKPAVDRTIHGPGPQHTRGQKPLVKSGIALVLILSALLTADGLQAQQTDEQSPATTTTTPPTTSAAINFDIAEIQSALASPFYEERTAAEKTLVSAGFDSTVSVAQLLLSDNHEVAWRAERILLSLFSQTANPAQSKKLQLILDLAIARGNDDLLPVAVETKKNSSLLNARRQLEALQESPNITVTEYPNFPGRIMIVNGRVVESNPAVPEIDTDPTTLEGIEFAKQNFLPWVKKIVESPAEAIDSLADQIRAKGVQLIISDTKLGNVPFGLAISIVKDLDQEDQLRIAALSRVVTQLQMSLTQLEITEERHQWLVHQMTAGMSQSLSLHQCEINAKQLQELEAKYGTDYLVVVGRAMIGIKGNSLITAVEAEQFVGAEVTEVTPDSGAEKGGVKVGDRIIEINGDKVRDFKHLRYLVASFGPDEEIEVTVARGESEEPIRLRIKLKPYAETL